MDLEKVALEAVKIKIQEIFDEIIVSTGMEGKDIVIRISLPDEIMKNTVNAVRIKSMEESDTYNLNKLNEHLDAEAQAAANELLGINSQEKA